VPPRVSVVLPLHDLRDYVGQAVESVLAQTVPADDVEIVVIDDGSRDGGGEVARSYAPRVRVVRQDNRGLSAARNAGIALTGAPLIAFLDADDRFLPDKLAASLALLDARRDVDLAYTGYHFIDERGDRLPPRGWPREEGDLFPRLLLGYIFHPLAIVVRRACVERAGGFDETLDAYEDWDLWLRISRQGARWGRVDRALAEYRIRPGAMHTNPDRMARNARRVLSKAFADPTLPTALRKLAPAAHEHAYLCAAAEHYRAADAAGGAYWFREAARVRPSFLTEPRALGRFCRLLLPPESQTGRTVATDARRLLRVLRAALGDFFGDPDLAPELARIRWRARLAYWRTAARFARKGVRASVVGSRRRRSDSNPTASNIRG